MRKVSTEIPRGKLFACSNPNNFVVIWNGITFGCADGIPFTSGQFLDPKSENELNWLKHELLFLDSIREKMEAYKLELERRL